MDEGGEEGWMVGSSVGSGYKGSCRRWIAVVRADGG